MSTLNLVPWRERHRRAVMGRWQWGMLISGLLTACLVQGLDQALVSINQAHEERMASFQTHQRSLQAQLSDAVLWKGRERQAKQVQLAWPRWQQRQAQAWQAMLQLLNTPPTGLQLTQAEWQDGQWRLQLRALHSAQVQRWQAVLQAQGVALTVQPGGSPAEVWRCPEGRLWRLHSFDLLSTQRGDIS